MKKLVFLVLWLCAFGNALAQYYGDYVCKNNTDVMVHLFEWKHSDVARECEEFLGPYGFCGVQISPPHEHRVVNGDHPDGPHVVFPWWQRYQPVSYLLDSRSGSEAEFIDMVERCNNAGVNVYVDALLNHMTQSGSGVGSAGSSWNGDTLDYPGVPYSEFDFHYCGTDCFTWDCNIGNYNNADEVRKCRLGDLRDLAGGDEYVRDMLADYLNKLIDYGVAGFRLDASKHMYPGDVDNVMGRLNDLNTQWFPADTKPYVYMEVIDLGGEAVSADDYLYIGRVTEFKYGMNLGDVVRKNFGQKLSYLSNFGEGWGMMAGLSALVFVDNHDNQRGHGAGGFSRILTFFESNMYKIANAFQLAWPYGHVRLMSSYFWPRDIQGGRDVNDWMGPPSDSNGNTWDVECFVDPGFVCEHRWRQMYNMVRFHNVALGTSVLNWWDNGENAIAFSRGDKAFIVINNEGYTLTDYGFSTGLPDGEYCDVITCDNPVPPCGNSGGSCRDTVTVSGGYATITVPNGEDPMIALHVEE